MFNVPAHPAQREREKWKYYIRADCLSHSLRSDGHDSFADYRTHDEGRPVDHMRVTYPFIRPV